MKRIITITLTIALLVIAGFSAIQIVNSLEKNSVESDPLATSAIDTEGGKRALDLLNEQQVKTPETAKVITDYTTSADRWYTVNNKTTGTITIEGLRDEPIVTNNTVEGQNEYLYKNIEGESSKKGTLFTAYDAELGVTNVTTVFGHSMGNGEMFGTLKNFKELNYVKNNPTFKMSSLKANYNLKIVAVADVSNDYYDSGWYYPQSNLTEKEFENFKKEVRNRSYFVIPDEFNYESKYVILSCCDYAFDGERLIVVARIMDECEIINTTNYVNNSVVLRANEYYEVYGKTKPSESKLNENRIKNYGE